VVTFCTNTTGVPGCNRVPVVSVTGGASSPIITLPNGGLVLTSNQQTGLSVDFNMGGTLTLTGQTITRVDLSAAANLTTIPLGTTHPSDLTSTQLDYLEDILGSVTVNGNNVTITTANHGAITAVADSNTFFSPNCNLPGIGDGTNTIKCVQANQIASIDAILNDDGTIKLIAYDPISAVSTTNNDFIEGVVAFAPTTSNQFTIIASDAAFIPSSTALPKPVPIGTTVNVTLNPNGPTPFAVDTNGLAVADSDIANFNNSAGSATELLPGQMVAVRVTAFTSNSAVFAVTTDAVELRSSRIAGTAAQNGTNTGFLYTGTSLPPYLGINLPTPLVEFTTGAPPTFVRISKRNGTNTFSGNWKIQKPAQDLPGPAFVFCLCEDRITLTEARPPWYSAEVAAAHTAPGPDRSAAPPPEQVGDKPSAIWLPIPKAPRQT
jgi:hypothetical protein